MGSITAPAMVGVTAVPSAEGRLRYAPPHPLGEDVDAFPYGAATAPCEADPAGPFRLGVKISPPADGSGTYRSGDVVEGWVTLTANEENVHALVETLEVRMYYECVDDILRASHATRL